MIGVARLFSPARHMQYNILHTHETRRCTMRTAQGKACNPLLNKMHSFPAEKGSSENAGKNITTPHGWVFSQYMVYPCPLATREEFPV